MSQSLEDAMSKFETLKLQVEGLQTKIEEYLAKVHGKIITKKREYEQALTQISDQERELQEKVSRLNSTQQELVERINDEVNRRDNSSLEVKEYSLQQDEIMKQKDKFEQEIKNINAKIDETMQEVKKQREFIANQTSLIDDKNYQFEQLLGLRIETGNSDNLISFIFKNVDPDDFSKEVYFVMDPEEYNIVETSPKLDNNTVTKVMDSFKKHKEIGYLWKDMRSELKEKLLA